MVLSIIFLEDKHNILFHLSIFYEYQQFFQNRICFSIQPPDYSDPWTRLTRPTSFFIIMLFKYICSWTISARGYFSPSGQCPWVWSVCRSHNPVLSSFTIYQLVCSMSNTTGTTSGAEIAHSSGTPEFYLYPVFFGRVCNAQS